MFFRRNVRLLMILFVSLGMVIFLLPGCGSDSKSVTGEQAAASPKAKKEQPAIPLAMDNGKGAPAAGKILKEPDYLLSSKEFLSPDAQIIPGVTRKEIEAKLAAIREEPPPDFEVIPGISRKQVEAQLEARREKPLPDFEVMPGITRKELEARLAAQRAMPTGAMEVIPGVTLDELNARRGQEVAPKKWELLGGN
jgi:hypothetical protein